MSDKLKGGTTIGGYTAWHRGNDGAGSGLDADLLDGQDGSYYATSTHTHDYLSTDYLDTNRYVNDANTADSEGITAYYVAYGTGSNTPSAAGENNHSLLTLSYSNVWSTQMAASWQTNNWYVRVQNNGVWGSWAKIWHESNDGAGSGLDADLLDGQEASSFASNIHNKYLSVDMTGLSSVSLDVGSYDVFLLSNFSSTVTINFSNFFDGRTVIIAMDSVNTSTISWGETILWRDGGTPPSYSASSIDLITITRINSSMYLGSYSLDHA